MRIFVYEICPYRDVKIKPDEMESWISYYQNWNGSLLYIYSFYFLLLSGVQFTWIPQVPKIAKKILYRDKVIMRSIINFSEVISDTSDKDNILSISFTPKYIIDYKGHPLRYFPLFLEYILCDITLMSWEVSLDINKLDSTKAAGPKRNSCSCS